MRYSYEEFKNHVTDEVLRELGKDGEKYHVSAHADVKLNHFGGPAITFNREGEMAGSVWYPEKSYEEYQRGNSIDAIVRKVSEKARVKLFDTVSIEGKGLIHALMSHDWEGIRQHVRLIPVGYERNKDRLGEYPYIRQGDICGVCKVALPMNDTGSVGYVTITNDQLQTLGIDQETLLKTAKENSQRNDPAICKNLQDLLDELTGGIARDEMEPGFDGPELMPVYVLSSQSRENGAAVIFHDKVMENVHEEFPQGFYILPSSVHELLIVPKNMADETYLEEMVQMINVTEVSPEEVLSDHVHTYDPARKMVVCKGMEPVQERKIHREKLQSIL